MGPSASHGRNKALGQVETKARTTARHGSPVDRIAHSVAYNVAN
jgi:hypothetical protein